MTGPSNQVSDVDDFPFRCFSAQGIAFAGSFRVQVDELFNFALADTHKLSDLSGCPAFLFQVE